MQNELFVSCIVSPTLGNASSSVVPGKSLIFFPSNLLLLLEGHLIVPNGTLTTSSSVTVGGTLVIGWGKKQMFEGKPN